LKYIRPLDSLRAIAVIFVIIGHWITFDIFINRIALGPIGVDIFFVLSGFLISRILFDARNETEVLGTPKTTAIKNFYIRRTLRIFPIYYLLILVVYIFADSSGTHIRENYLYYLTYTSNYYFYFTQDFDGIMAHLWSLAVEEQFYLIWPWMMLFANKKYLLPIILSCITIGVVSQCLLYGVPMKDGLTFTCLDAFGLGALLSWVMTYAPGKLKQFYRFVSYGAIVFLVLFYLHMTQPAFHELPVRTLASFLALYVITYIVINDRDNSLKFKFLFNNKVLLFVGKISYGIYLYHLFVPNMLYQKIINVYLNPLLPDVVYVTHWQALYLVENAIMLVLLSWLSYQYIEKPFLSLKKRFKYTTQEQQAKAV
jgi:peptidoglycan/LPS O-acetylase OafA/YrhL